jgi:hypothetical protein
MISQPTIKAGETKVGEPRPFPFRPMFSISGARSLLPGADEDELVRLIDSRQIEVAFNISLGSQSRRREIRILPAALEFYKQHGGKKSLGWDWQRIAIEILNGYGLDWISGKDMRLLLNCGDTQVSTIIAVGRMALAPGSLCRPGPHGSPRVMLQSFLAWLRRRKIF